MKKSQPIVIILMCFALFLILSTCGNNNSNNSNPTETPTQAPTETQTEPNAPTEPVPTEPPLEHLYEARIDGVKIDINNFSITELASYGFEVKSTDSWQVTIEEVPIYGVKAKKDSKELCITAESYENNSTGGNIYLIGTKKDRGYVGCEFYNGIKPGISFDDLLAKTDGLRYYVIVGRAEKVYYVAYNDNNILVSGVKDDVVDDVYLVIRGKFDITLSQKITSQEMLRGLKVFFEQNVKVEWFGSTQPINCTTNVSTFVLEGHKFNFNKLTYDDLCKAGYSQFGDVGFMIVRGNGEGDRTTLYFVRLANDTGAEIRCIFTEDGHVEYMCILTIPQADDDNYDENAVQANYKILTSITPRSSKQDLFAELNKIGIKTEGENNFTTQTIVRGEDVCIRFSTKDGQVSRLEIINNRLAWPTK